MKTKIYEHERLEKVGQTPKTWRDEGGAREQEEEGNGKGNTEVKGKAMV